MGAHREHTPIRRAQATLRRGVVTLLGLDDVVPAALDSLHRGIIPRLGAQRAC